jgi:phosphoribosylformylglycinamidine synthase subunit PurQ / glutaminase
MVRVAVVRFPGSNCEDETLRAVRRAGGEAFEVRHRERDLRDADVVILPGGFSYGDYLRAGAIARFSPVLDAVIRHVADGRPVLGVCNGFQILCEAGLLPGVLRPNSALAFVCRDVALRVERARAPFTSRCEVEQRLVIPVKHGEGCYFAPQELLAELEQAGQVVLRYEDGDNPNGSLADIAGVASAAGNVMGLMPHPEHAVDPRLGSTDGAFVLGSLVDAARERTLAAA